MTLEDIRKVRREDWTTIRIRDVMTKALVVATPDETAAAALEKLARRDVEQLPVIGAANRRPAGRL